MAPHLRLAASTEAELRPDSSTPLIRVLLADDHAMVRRTMRTLLDDERDIHVTAEASELSSVVDHLHRDPPNVLVLDLHLRNGSALEAIRRLRAQAPQTEIVVLTMEESPQFALQAIDAGALGFVLKDRADSELAGAIRHAARGEEFVSVRMAAGLEVLQRAIGVRGLSPRETEILRLIALGFTSREIATKLNLSRRTVETHRSRIHSKLDLVTRAELVQFALGHHMIE